MLWNKEKILGLLALLMTKAFNLTYRYVYLNPELKKQTKLMSKNGNFLLAFWHQTFFPIIMLSEDNNTSTLISPSRDGDIVAFVCRGFKISVSRGSSSRQGASALKQIIRLIQAGKNIIITIDGPKGPIYKVKRGILEMSKIAQVPILPISNYPSSYWQFKSWDKFRIAKPFSTIYIKYGDPFIVDKNITKEHFTDLSLKLEQNLLDLERSIKKTYDFKRNKHKK